jgi:hypothetical protein
LLPPNQPISPKSSTFALTFFGFAIFDFTIGFFFVSMLVLLILLSLRVVLVQKWLYETAIYGLWPGYLSYNSGTITIAPYAFLLKICRGSCASSCTAGGRNSEASLWDCRQNWWRVTAIPSEPMKKQAAEKHE